MVKKEGYKKMSNILMKSILILFIIKFSIFVSSCSSNSSGTQSGISENVYKGTQGIVVTFLENVLPTKLYVSEGTELPVAVKIENKGAYTLNSGDLKLFFGGFDVNYITFQKASSDGEIPIDEIIEGKTRFNSYGGSTIYDDSAEINLPNFLNSYNPKFQVSWLYDYETVASGVVCIDPAPFGLSKVQKPCTVKDVSLSGGQGAPVEVTKIEVIPVSTEKVNFIIHVKNSGTGIVVNGPYSNSYSGSVERPNDIKPSTTNKIGEYEVSIGGTSLGSGDSLSCSPSVVQFFQDRSEAIIQCPYDFSGNVDNAYETVLQIKLKYRYYDSVSRQLSLLKVDNDESSSGSWW